MKVGIVGTGTLGPSIAQVFAQCEQIEAVYLCKGRESSKRNGKDTLEKSLLKLVSKGKMTREQAEAVLDKIVTGPKTILHDADLVVEAVSENLDIKKAVFRELDNICKPECILATNTSSLPIKAVGEGVTRPMIGMHFFNPADRMKLVEVIRGENTPQDMVDKITAIATEIGKTPVQVKEAPGFVVNRILIPMINEAIGVLDAGTASAEDIDVAMQLGASHPMGPLHLGDLIGLDICLAIMEVLYNETKDEKYAPQPLLKKMVEEKKLGRKTGVGFFDYSK